MKKLLLLILLAVCWLTACTDEDIQPPPSTVDTKEWTLDGNMDTSCRPGDNFFMYCNGTWYKNATVGERGYVGLYADAFNILNERISSLDNELMAKLQKGVETVDQTTEASVAAIKRELKTVGQITTKEEAGIAIAKNMQMGYETLFKLKMSLFEDGTIGAEILPTIRGVANVDWVAECFKTVGMTDDEARIKARKVVDLERQLFAAMPQTKQSLPVNRKYTGPRPVTEPFVNTRTRGSNRCEILDKLIETIGKEDDTVGVYDYTDKYVSVLESADLSSIQAILQYGIAKYIYLTSHANLSKYNRLSDDKRTFEGELSSIRYGYMNYLFSYAYAAKYMTETKKMKFEKLAEECREAFRERIINLDWLSEATKQRALSKLAAIRFNVGYPDQWVKEGLAELTDGLLIENLYRLRRASFALTDFFINKKYRDVFFNYKLAFEYNLADYNAYYYGECNSVIVFPAFILEPYYKEDASDAYNYALSCLSLGHEMIHGFDSDGSEYNETGEYENWWTEEDRQKYLAKQQSLIDCYNSLEVMPDELPGLYADGEKTLDENIADLGGFEIGYQAYMNKLKREGYYGDELIKQKKRFYQAFAEAYRKKYSVYDVKYYMENDTHSLDKERVNGVVMNTDRWYELYNVKPGDKLYLVPEKRTHIW